MKNDIPKTVQKKGNFESFKIQKAPNHKPTLGPKDVVEALAAIGIKKSIRWVQKHAPRMPGVSSNSSGIQIPSSCVAMFACIPDMRGKRKK